MESDKYSLLEITGESCAACYAVMPEAQEAAKENNLSFSRVQAEANGELIKKWKVEKIPAIFILYNGEPIARCYGYQPQEILTLWIDAKIREHQGKR